MTNNLDDLVSGMLRRVYNLEQGISNPSLNTGGSTGGGGTNGTYDDLYVRNLYINGHELLGDPPTAVTSITTVPGGYLNNLFVDVSWSAVTEATSYSVILAEKDTAAGTYKTPQIANTQTTATRFSNLEASTTYGVKIVVLNNLGLSSTPFPSTGYHDFSTTTDTTIPAAPTGVTVSSASVIGPATGSQLGSISGYINWDPNTEPDVALGKGAYEVQVSTFSNFAVDATHTFQGITAGQLLHYTLTGINVSAAFTLYVRVRAIDSSGNQSTWASINYNVTSAAHVTGYYNSGTAPDGVVNSSVKSTGGLRNLALRWDPITTDDDVIYEVYVSDSITSVHGTTTDDPLQYGMLATGCVGITKAASFTASTYFDSNVGVFGPLSNNVNYYVKIVTRTAAGAQPWSGNGAGPFTARKGLVSTNDLADGVAGTHTYIQSHEPTGGTYASGDQWIDSNDGTIYGWDTDTLSWNKVPLTADQIAVGAITAGTIAAGAVTTDSLAADAVTADKIAANTITADQIAANTITSGLIAAGAITADKFNASEIIVAAASGGQVFAAPMLIDDMGSPVGAAQPTGYTSHINNLPHSAGLGDPSTNYNMVVDDDYVDASGTHHGPMFIMESTLPNTPNTFGIVYDSPVSFVKDKDYTITLKLSCGGVSTAGLHTYVLFGFALDTSFDPSNYDGLCFNFGNDYVVDFGNSGVSKDGGTTTGLPFNISTYNRVGFLISYLGDNDNTITLPITALSDTPLYPVIGAYTVFNGTESVHFLGVESVQIVRNLSGTDLAPGSIGTTEIAPGSITTELISASKISGDVIAAGTIDGEKIIAGTIDGDRIIANTLDVGSIKSGTLESTIITIGDGGRLIVGDPPDSGIYFDETGLWSWKNSEVSFSLQADGTATFGGDLSAPNITGGTMTGGVITGGDIVGAEILGGRGVFPVPDDASVDYPQAHKTPSATVINDYGIFIDSRNPENYSEPYPSKNAPTTYHGAKPMEVQVDGTIVNIDGSEFVESFPDGVTAGNYIDQSNFKLVNHNGYVTWTEDNIGARGVYSTHEEGCIVQNLTPDGGQLDKLGIPQDAIISVEITSNQEGHIDLDKFVIFQNDDQFTDYDTARQSNFDNIIGTAPKVMSAAKTAGTFGMRCAAVSGGTSAVEWNKYRSNYSDPGVAMSMKSGMAEFVISNALASHSTTEIIFQALNATAQRMISVGVTTDNRYIVNSAFDSNILIETPTTFLAAAGDKVRLVWDTSDQNFFEENYVFNVDLYVWRSGSTDPDYHNSYNAYTADTANAPAVTKVQFGRLSANAYAFNVDLDNFGLLEQVSVYAADNSTTSEVKWMVHADFEGLLSEGMDVTTFLYVNPTPTTFRVVGGWYVPGSFFDNWSSSAGQNPYAPKPKDLSGTGLLSVGPSVVWRVYFHVVMNDLNGEDFKIKLPPLIPSQTTLSSPDDVYYDPNPAHIGAQIVFYNRIQLEYYGQVSDGSGQYNSVLADYAPSAFVGPANGIEGQVGVLSTIYPVWIGAFDNEVNLTGVNDSMFGNMFANKVQAARSLVAKDLYVYGDTTFTNGAYLANLLLTDDTGGLTGTPRTGINLSTHTETGLISIDPTTCDAYNTWSLASNTGGINYRLPSSKPMYVFTQRLRSKAVGSTAQYTETWIQYAWNKSGSYVRYGLYDQFTYEWTSWFCQTSRTGSIALFPGTTVPDGWLRCNGTSYNSTTDPSHQLLYDAMTDINDTVSGISSGALTVPNLTAPSGTIYCIKR